MQFKGLWPLSCLMQNTTDPCGQSPDLCHRAAAKTRPSCCWHHKCGFQGWHQQPESPLGCSTPRNLTFTHCGTAQGLLSPTCFLSTCNNVPAGDVPEKLSKLFKLESFYLHWKCRCYRRAVCLQVEGSTGMTPLTTASPLLGFTGSWNTSERNTQFQTGGKGLQKKLYTFWGKAFSSGIVWDTALIWDTLIL